MRMPLGIRAPNAKNLSGYLRNSTISASSSFDSLFSLVKVEKSHGVTFIEHKVRRGDNLWDIARKYNSSISAIREINKIKGRTIQIGWMLQIPTEGYSDYRKSTSGSKSKTGKYIYHTVKLGDTLSEIAEKYRTSVRNIKRWNGLRNYKIRIGQKLKIWKRL